MKFLKKRNLTFSIIAFIIILVSSFISLQKYIATTITIELSEQQMLQEAKALFESIVDMRSWNAQYGGVFVKQTDKIKPNPYLKNNIMYSDEQEAYVKINPAWMTRQISEISNAKGGAYHYKMTSLNPLNPNNKADEFEREALTTFEQNKNQLYYYRFDKDKETFDFMGALITDKACLSCHAIQGYKVGDIRGGIRVSLPSTIHNEKMVLLKKEATKSYYIVIIISILALGISYWVITLFYKRQDEIEHANEILEIKVSERTQKLEIAIANEQHLKDILKIIAEINELLIINTEKKHILETITKKISSNQFYPVVITGLYNNEKVEIISQSQTNTIENDDFDETVKMAIKAAKPVTKQISLKNYSSTDKFWLAVLPMINLYDNKAYGLIAIVSLKDDGFRIEELNILENLTQDISMAIYSHEQSDKILKMEQEKSANYQETIIAFVDMIEKRDSYTAGHTIRVAHYSALIAKNMGYSDEEIRRLEKAAILHDIGKIATPDMILLKPGKLSNLEYELIKQHSKVGYDMLSKISIYKNLANIIKYHHSRYDGKGYPETSSPDEIPMLSHIMIVADAFDAMTTNRIYRAGKSVQTALEVIEYESGKQFHPDVVKSAIKILKNINLENTSQIPQSELEKKRMAYFFLDSLTELYNEDYLKIIFSQNHKYQYITIISLGQFTEYNHIYGWDQGNKILKNIASSLKELYPDYIIARVHGDNFIVLSEAVFTINPEEFKNNILVKVGALKINIHYHKIEKDFKFEDMF